MYVVIRKSAEDKKWNVCGAFAQKFSADAEIAKQVESGREAKAYRATHVWVDENGNHTWTA